VANENALKISREFAEAVKSQFSNCRIYLFGSQIKGTFHKDSDIDIAVVLNNYENKSEMFLKLMQIRRKIDSRIEPHPFRESDFTESNQLVQEILEYGIEI